MIPTPLLDGYRRFRQERLDAEKARYRELAAGQSPETMIIGCADSRVDPATIFAAAPGELFVARNVAALVPPCEADAAYHGTSAALEFAVTELKVRRIVVMGHGLCGGVAASLGAAANKPPGRFIGPWIELLSPVRDDILAATGDGARRQRLLEQRSILLSIANLKSFPFVVEAVDAGRLALHGAWFSIAEAELHWYDADANAFLPVKV